jgi:hypothetical protein
MSSKEHRHNVRWEDSPVKIPELQEEYLKELYRRFSDIRGTLRETIQENDALRIKGGRMNDGIEPRDDFEFEEDPLKQIEFRKQLEQWLEDGLLEPMSMSEVEEGNHYTAIYVSAGYAQGMEFGGEMLVDRGQTLAADDISQLISAPIHASELETVYSRNYEGLEDITEDMDDSISSIMTRALRQGWGTSKTANKITREVRDIQNTRAKTLVRTEMLNSHNKGALRRYEQYGVTEVEILTHTPCPICQRIEENDPYPISEAPRLPLDTHPNCVCSYAPVV